MRFAFRAFLLVFAIGCGRVRYEGEAGADGGPDAETDASHDADAREGDVVDDVRSDVDGESDAVSDADAMTDATEDTMSDADAAPGVLVPANVGARLSIAGGDANLVVADSQRWVFDTDTGTVGIYGDDSSAPPVPIRGAGEGDVDAILFRRLSGAGVGLGVFQLQSLSVLSGGLVYGYGSRALVLLVSESVDIDGRVSVTPNLMFDYLPNDDGGQPAAGSAQGGLCTRGTNPGGGLPGDAIDATHFHGGGGGSFGSRGGAGGSADAVSTPGQSGPTFGEPDLDPITAGGGGAGGLCPGDGLSTGGYSGGAIQISAGGSIIVSGSGVVDASGGGGRRAFNDAGGGGGGSGGAILLEAPVVTISGSIGANGGGGGQGGVTGDYGANGATGDAIIWPASGALGSSFAGGGGAGSNDVGVAGDGTDAQHAGGGGGGAGRIRIQTATGTETYELGITPAASTGLVTVGVITTS